jgi:hypothetical protein
VLGTGAGGRRRLGEEYLERTRIHRKTDRPRFIDKMPNNWQHVGAALTDPAQCHNH